MVIIIIKGIKSQPWWKKPFSLFKGQNPPTKARGEGVRKRNPLVRKKDGLRSKRI
jgi:hypothetical protein